MTAVLTVCYFVAKFSRKRRPGEPPIVKGNLLLGSANDFSTQAVDFLHKTTEKYGEIFTIRLINQYLTIIADPHSFEAMSKERNFDFDPIQKQVNWNVFSFVLREPRKMIKDTGRTVRGHFLYKGMQSYLDNLETAFDRQQALGENEWHTMGLRSFSSKTIFDALFNTIFGRGDHDKFESQSVYKNFEVFHKFFNYFWLGMPKSLFTPAMKALGELLCQPLSEELLARPDVSDYIKTAINYMKQQGQTDSEIKGHNLVYLHVNYNTFRLAFWVINNILTDEKCLAQLQDEIDTMMQDRLDSETNSASITFQEIENMKILNSVVQESIRMSSGVFMIRYVNQDTNFTVTDSGKSYLVRGGDRVAIYPPAIHKDPEIFQEPETFKHDRFVDATFYKNGKELKNPLLAFGSLCPGKRFALLQLKWFIVRLLTRFEMRLEDGAPAEYDNSYHGHEILPPKSDINLTFRHRPNPPTLEFMRD